MSFLCVRFDGCCCCKDLSSSIVDALNGAVPVRDLVLLWCCSGPVCPSHDREPARRRQRKISTQRTSASAARGTLASCKQVRMLSTVTLEEDIMESEEKQSVRDKFMLAERSTDRTVFRVRS